jgi:hypothetical protein
MSLQAKNVLIYLDITLYEVKYLQTSLFIRLATAIVHPRWRNIDITIIIKYVNKYEGKDDGNRRFVHTGETGGCREQKPVYV